MFIVGYGYHRITTTHSFLILITAYNTEWFVNKEFQSIPCGLVIYRQLGYINIELGHFHGTSQVRFNVIICGLGIHRKYLSKFPN